MNTLNFFMSLFNSGRGVRQIFKLVRRNRGNNRGWLFISLLGVGAIFSVVARRNVNGMKPIQRFFQGFQRRASTFMPPRLNTAMMEFAEEITPINQKK